MFTKAKFYNLALGALLLQRQVINPETDQSNEAKVLNTFYDVAWRAALADMDLDSTSSQIQLELLATDPIHGWCFAYKYPKNCAFFRRIQSCVRQDSRQTHIPKRVAIFNAQKVILTNKCNAIAEFIPEDIPLSTLAPNAGLAVSFRLAILAAPLATGKGAAALINAIEKKYVMAKAEAQQQDERENFTFESEATMSEFVAVRLE